MYKTFITDDTQYCLAVVFCDFYPLNFASVVQQIRSEQGRYKNMNSSKKDNTVIDEFDECYGV